MAQNGGSPRNPTSVIRAATSEDIDALVELAATTFRETHEPYLDLAEINDYIADKLTPATFESILADEASFLRVCEDGDRLFGYLHLRRSTAPACVTGCAPVELVRIYLRREAIGRGFGAGLMRSALAEAERQGGDTLWLLVYEKNERARCFYRRWGFADVGTASFWFGGREYFDPVMALSLTGES
jgi:GNAT superfamily N-acetyltransferase